MMLPLLVHGQQTITIPGKLKIRSVPKTTASLDSLMMLDINNNVKKRGFDTIKTMAYFATNASSSNGAHALYRAINNMGYYGQVVTSSSGVTGSTSLLQPNVIFFTGFTPVGLLFGNQDSLGYTGMYSGKGYTHRRLVIKADSLERLYMTQVKYNTAANDSALVIGSDGLLKKQPLPISGSITVSASSQTTFTVTIGTTQENTNYKVQATPASITAASLFYVNNKTTTTFDIVFLISLTGTVKMDWAVFK